MNAGYHATRLSPDSRRQAVWKALWKYFFRHRVKPGDCVLDIGAGYGDFINSVAADRRLAIDSWQDMPRHVDPAVEARVGQAWELDWIEDASVDLAFASNLFEHLTKPDFALTLAALAPKLKPTGRLTILQPNYRYAYREYFDDFTHVSVFSDVSMADFLESNGWRVIELRPRFLPLTIKSRLPVSEFLIRAYLASPFKPLAKQMLVSAVPPGNVVSR